MTDRRRSPPPAGKVVVETAGGAVDVDLAEVVYLWLLRSSFWKRIDGSLSIGGPLHPVEPRAPAHPSSSWSIPA